MRIRMKPLQVIEECVATAADARFMAQQIQGYIAPDGKAPRDQVEFIEQLNAAAKQMERTSRQLRLLAKNPPR